MGKAIDTGKIVIGVYLNIKKTFDVISHPILLRNSMFLASEVIFLIGLKATLLIDHNLCHIIMLNLKSNLLHMVFHRDPFLGPLFLIVFLGMMSPEHLIFYFQFFSLIIPAAAVHVISYRQSQRQCLAIWVWFWIDLVSTRVCCKYLS